MVKITLSRVMGEKRITQKELSRATKIRPNTINDLYHDVAYSISVANLSKICEALHCNLGDIFTYTPDPIRTTNDAQPTKVYKSKDNTHT